MSKEETLVGRRRQLAVSIVVVLLVIGGLYIYYQRPRADSLVLFETQVRAARLEFERQNFTAAAAAYEVLADDIDSVDFQDKDTEQKSLEEVYTYWALATLNTKNYDAAASIGQRYLSIAQNPTADFFAIYGNVFRLRGDLDGAIAQYERALVRTPRHLITSINLADVYVEQGRLPEAQALAEEALETAKAQAQVWYTEGDPLLYWLLASIYEKSGEPEKAALARETAARVEGIDKPVIQISPQGSE